MLGTVRFDYDAVHDIHYVYPKWLVETEEDCRVWYGQFVDYFSKFDAKVDVIIVLDEFRLGPKIGSLWGKYRSDWISRYTRHSVRINADARASTYSATSAAIHGGGYEEAADLKTAVQFILKRRQST